MKKIVVLGLNHGCAFAKAVKHTENAVLIAAAGRGRQAEELDVPVYEDYLELLDKHPEADGAVIALPNKLHLPAAEACAKRGIDMLVEKPLAPTIEEGEAIINVCREYGVSLAVGHHRRFSSKVRRLEQIVASGELGMLIGGTMVWALAKDKEYYNEAWRTEEGGGPLLINSTHDIDNLRFVTKLTFTSVYAAAQNSIRGNVVEDSASILLETKEGPSFTYFLSDGAPSPWSYEVTARENSKYVSYKENCYHLFGSRGSVSFPQLDVYRYTEEQHGWYEPLQHENQQPDMNDPFARELHHFINVLYKEEKPFVTGEDALETMKVVHAVKRSIKQKEKVMI